MQLLDKRFLGHVIGEHEILKLFLEVIGSARPE